MESSNSTNFSEHGIGQVRRLEAQGLPSKQAETITAAVTDVLNSSLENVSQSFVSKPEMQKVRTLLCCWYNDDS